MSNDTDADLTALIDGRVVGFTSAAPWGGTITSYGIVHTGKVRAWLSDRAVAGGEDIEDVTVTEVYVPLAEAERLTRERDDARAENERLRREYTPCDLDLLSRAEAAEAEVADLRTRLADAEATIQRVRALRDRLDRGGFFLREDLRAALDGPQDGGEGR